MRMAYRHRASDGRPFDGCEVGGADQLTLDLRVAIEGHDRPACVAQAIWRHYDFEAPG